jgi:hypothetical protein
MWPGRCGEQTCPEECQWAASTPATAETERHESEAGSADEPLIDGQRASARPVRLCPDARASLGQKVPVLVCHQVPPAFEDANAGAVDFTDAAAGIGRISYKEFCQIVHFLTGRDGPGRPCSARCSGSGQI